jgi:protein-tyrosine phosphatase
VREVPHHRLWLGNAGDGRDFRRILDSGIQAVVQVAAEEPIITLPRDLVYCRFPLLDGLGNETKLLLLAIATVANLLEKKVPTLIVCGAGLSRSPAVAAASLALALSQSPDECLKQVAEHFPADVSPALWSDIKSLIDAWRL